MHSFSFFKFSIILKLPSGFGLKKILGNLFPSIPVITSFITPFFKSFLISLSKIFISVLFLGCSKFELLIGCWLYYTKYICNFLISVSRTFSSCCIGPCSSSHRRCFVLMGSSSCFLNCMGLMSYCCKGCMMTFYFYNSEVYLSNY